MSSNNEDRGVTKDTIKVIRKNESKNIYKKKKIS